MLKIKDNVDLKELGFEKDEDDFIYGDNFDLLLEDNRVIFSHQFFGDLGEKRLDRLYDLIQDGLVEKVDD